MSTSLFGEIIFGPIRSRRLGASLGVNLLPVSGKICSFDCIYCECGLNEERRGGKFPIREVVTQELEKRLVELSNNGEAIDVITFAGNGEPTLHPEFSTIIADTLALRDRYFPMAKVSVLSNSTMIDKPAVFAALKSVDNNILKLDAGTEAMVRLMDAPNQPNFSIEKTIELLKSFNGSVVIQTMFLRGTCNGHIVDNTTPSEIDAWLKALIRIAPKQVMIYSIDRPTPMKDLQKIEKEELEQIADQVRALGIDVTVS